MAVKKLRVGVVGCGAIHGTHCDSIGQIEGAELTCVVDTNKTAGMNASEKYGVPHFSSIEDIWDSVDAVTLCVPSGLHSELGQKAAKAGKHVLSEKPIDINFSSAKKLVDTCKESKVTLGVVSQHRFATDVRKLRDAVQGGAMGRMLQADMYNKWYRGQAYYDSGDWRGTWELDGGGCLMNQGVHYVDLLQWIMGGIKSVQAQVRTAAHERISVEDIANVLVEFNNGAVGVIQGSTSVYPGLAERIEVHGLYGTVLLEADRIKLWKVDAEGSQLGLYGDGVVSQPAPKVTFFGEKESGNDSAASDPTAAWGAQHRMQIEDFVQAIADGREPFLSGEAALEPLKVILAIYESGRNNGASVLVSSMEK